MNLLIAIKIFLYILPSLLGFYSLETENRYENQNQFIALDVSTGERSSVIGNIRVINTVIEKNAEGKYYDYAFNSGDARVDFMKSANTKIVALSNQNVIFEGVTPEFSHLFVDSESGYIFLADQVTRELNQFWVFNPDGEVVYKGIVLQSLYVGDSYQDLLGLASVSNNVINQLQREIVAFGDLENSNEGNSNEENSNEENSGDEEAQGIRIVMACGRIDSWLSQVVRLNFNRFGEFSGFIYKDDDEVRIFDIEANEKAIEQATREAGEEIADSFPKTCDGRSQLNEFFSGTTYSRWCENTDSTRNGRLEKWLLKSKLSDELLQMMPENNQQSITNRFMYVGGGKYINGYRNGVWHTVNADDEYLVSCQYFDGVLNGNCEENDGEYRFDSSYRNGLINGKAVTKNGDVIEETCEYVDGYRSGACNSFSDNTLQTSCNYYGESGQGVCSEYFAETGLIESQCEMLNDSYHGICTYFDSSGNVKRRAYYQYDEEVSEFKE